jgi:hypothetical protein
MISHRFGLYGLCTTLALCCTGFAGCDDCDDDDDAQRQEAGAAQGQVYDQLERLRFNQLAVRANLPLYWKSDANNNKAIDPDEIATLLFYPTAPRWVARGAFTPAFAQAYARILAADKAPAVPEGLAPDEAKRRALVVEELDQGRPTLVLSDLRALSADDKQVLAALLEAGALIDLLYARTSGITVLAGKVPIDDLASLSLFRRNWGPKCVAPKTEKDPACTAIPGVSKVPVDVYPADMQDDTNKFCATLEKRKDAKTLLSPFTVVRAKDKDLVALAYSEAYPEDMKAIAAKLREAARALVDPSEALFKAYLTAAAQAFTDNKWEPADEAWAKMNALNSKWYLRIAPDETYWEPCSQKAGFHMTLARINKASLQWQEKLTPLQQDMEDQLAGLVGKPYTARTVTFHLPDFIDLIVNCGDDRDALGATIGQSLPNWGPVANEGRGRTVAMTNLYTDPDSRAQRKEQARSLLTTDSLKAYSDDDMPGLLGTILHEATHNLGPAHEYKVKGKTDDQLFGGSLASMLEELKAQSGALWYLALLVKKGILTPEQVRQSYNDSFVWSLGHISRGMYTDSGQRKPYSQLSAIQVGFLMDEKVIRFDPAAQPANGTDKGAFILDYDKMPAAIDKLMKMVGTIKATGDRAAAEALAKKYVDGQVVPMQLITERMLRYPKASFVYAIER